MTKPKPKKSPSVKKVPSFFEPGWHKRAKRADGKATTRGEKELYKNPIEEIITTPQWFGSVSADVRDFAIQILTGYVWACKYDPGFIAYHIEASECEAVLHRLSWLKQQEEAKKWVPDETELLQLALIDFVRVLPKMWD
jgi:hypothetical protein